MTQLQDESRHLKQVHSKIVHEVERRESSLAGYRKDMMATRRTIWEDIPHNWQQGDFDAAVEVKQYLDGLKQDTQIHESEVLQVSKLKRLKGCPYFGRIDYLEEEAQTIEKIYIGILSFFDVDGELLIYDWRAPISGIFYDYELGPVAYQCQDGVLHGTVELKRQYRITEDTLHYMFDTGLKIDDELLQEILSKSTDEKMRNIVQTIQKEQNRIIRDETHQILMVQGAAGSGKTSIALHRIAYLLYKYRDQNITAQNILIFSPNTVFNDYISHVLPELGEENMHQTTFYEYMQRRVSKYLKIEDPSTHLEYLLTTLDHPDHISRHSGIQYKSTPLFLDMLNAYAIYLENGMRFEDLCLQGEVLVTQDEILHMFYTDYKYLPMVRRMKKMKERLYYLIRPIRKKRLSEITNQMVEDPEFKEKVKAHSRLAVCLEFKPVREKIESMLTFNIYQAYCAIFSYPQITVNIEQNYFPEDYQSICHDTTARLSQNIMGYEDLSGYVYLRGLLIGVPQMNHIRHVVIDEAQDYTPVQYGVFKQLFPKTKMTLLGDFNQAISPLAETFNYETVRNILKPLSHGILKMTKSYRSTVEIVEFTRNILQGAQQIEAVERKGYRPQFVIGDSASEVLEACIHDIQKMLDNGVESIGIITKTAAEGIALRQRVGKRLPLRLLTKDDTVYMKGILVLPVYLAKGLEFDAVVVYDADTLHYGHEQDRRLFYTACTRALHRLHLYAFGEITPFADKTLCDFQTTIEKRL